MSYIIEKDTRDACVEKLNKVVKNKKLSKQVEQNIYNVYQNKPKQYLNKMVSLYINFNSKSHIGNKQFLKKLKKKEINVDDIASMTPQEIYPEHWKNIVETRKINNEYLYSKRPESYSTIYTCGRCKKKKVSYYQIQTRSADEAMTVFYRCIVCRNKWRN
jgi:transcription elongation factor S-II